MIMRCIGVRQQIEPSTLAVSDAATVSRKGQDILSTFRRSGLKTTGKADSSLVPAWLQRPAIAITRLTLDLG